MTITPYIHYDLYSNGNFVKTFYTKEEIDKYFKDMFETEKYNWWNKNDDDILKKFNKDNYSIVKSEYLHFS